MVEPEKPGSPLLERIGQYKELLGIMVFFLGGFFWIQNQFNQFPTKTDVKSEVGILNCLLNEYMSLTQLQIRGRDLERQVQDLSDELTAFGADQNRAHPAISPAMQQALEAKKADLVAARGDLKTNTDAIQKTGDELARNLCGQVTR